MPELDRGRSHTSLTRFYHQHVALLRQWRGATAAPLQFADYLSFLQNFQFLTRNLAVPGEALT
jgi:hypothetical protein